MTGAVPRGGGRGPPPGVQSLGRHRGSASAGNGCTPPAEAAGRSGQPQKSRNLPHSGGGEVSFQPFCSGGVWGWRWRAETRPLVSPEGDVAATGASPPCGVTGGVGGSTQRQPSAPQNVGNTDTVCPIMQETRTRRVPKCRKNGHGAFSPFPVHPWELCCLIPIPTVLPEDGGAGETGAVTRMRIAPNVALRPRIAPNTALGPSTPGAGNRSRAERHPEVEHPPGQTRP